MSTKAPPTRNEKKQILCFSTAQIYNDPSQPPYFFHVLISKFKCVQNRRECYAFSNNIYVAGLKYMENTTISSLSWPFYSCCMGTMQSFNLCNAENPNGGATGAQL